MSGKWWEELPKASALDVALEAEGIGGALADVARSIYAQESGSGKNTTTSNAGAVGGMQILPGTFQQVADKGWDIADPIHNARAGVRYLKAMFDRADGDPALAAVGYYGGPGGQDKAKKGEAVSDPRNPKAPTTLEYAEQVVGRLPAGDKPPQASQKAADGGDADGGHQVEGARHREGGRAGVLDQLHERRGPLGTFAACILYGREYLLTYAEVAEDRHDIAGPADRDGRGGDAILQYQQPAHDPGEDLAQSAIGVGIGRA